MNDSSIKLLQTNRKPKGTKRKGVKSGITYKGLEENIEVFFSRLALTVFLDKDLLSPAALGSICKVSLQKGGDLGSFFSVDHSQIANSELAFET